MNAKLQRRIEKRKRGLQRRISPRDGKWQSPMFKLAHTKLELSSKQQAVACGGLAAILELAKSIDLRKHLNESAKVLKVHAPYDESDHIFNIALNILAGGTCLDHIETRRNDEAYLNAMGAERVPDPTTAGDFCRRYTSSQLIDVMDGINQARLKVWRQQEDSFFDEAIIEADGSMVETQGEKKSGIGINYKGQWGYHPLLITLAKTQEILFLQNRSGNRPSHEGSPELLDKAIDLCREAGFRKITLRGDTDFSSTQHLDRWDESGVKFVFGYDACKNLVALAESLSTEAWRPLERESRSVAAEAARAKRPNYKEAIVVENEYENHRLQGESYAEFEYRPTACKKSYRIVVVRKDIKVTKGQQYLFNKNKFFFYITNEDAKAVSPREVIRGANKRCNQENTISQAHACGALSAPLDSLESNGAYMLFASLSWTLKIWSGMMIRVAGDASERRARRESRNRIIRMEFSTYLNSLMLIPAQIVRSARQRIFRLLTYRPTVDLLFMMHENAHIPLRH